MEDWKDKIIGSLSGMDRAKPPTDAFTEIRRKLANRTKPKEQNQRHWLAVAAVILMVISSNVLLLSNYLNDEQQPSYTSEYSGMITSYNLYDNEQ
ncbi:MAG: hypothetical protein RIC80_03025 [Cyclobacteriaceae bacterium]